MKSGQMVDIITLQEVSVTLRLYTCSLAIFLATWLCCVTLSHPAVPSNAFGMSCDCVDPLAGQCCLVLPFILCCASHIPYCFSSCVYFFFAIFGLHLFLSFWCFYYFLCFILSSESPSRIDCRVNKISRARKDRC